MLGLRRRGFSVTRSPATAELGCIERGINVVSELSAGNLVPSLEAEYVNTSGTRVSEALEDGATITGVAPFMVFLDASGTRSVASDGDDEAGAIYNIGYLFNFGENLGGQWDYPDYPDPNDRPLKDEDTGWPFTTYVYTQPGTHTLRLRCRDSDGNEATKSVTVVVQDPGAGVDIPVSAGLWPNFQNNTTYNLDGNYTSFQTLNTGGKVGVVIRKKPGAVGTPIISRWNIEHRPVNQPSIPSFPRATNCRLQDIQVGEVLFSPMGFDYCGVIGGRAVTIDYDPSQSFYYDASDVTGETRLNTIRYPRGFVLWDCGPVESHASSVYCIYGTGRAFHARNIYFNKTLENTINRHVFRARMSHSNIRSCLMRSSVLSGSYIKMYAINVNSTYPTGTPWRDDDLVGHTTGAKTHYVYPTYKTFFHECQLGDSGHVRPNANAGFGPQTNRETAADEPLELCALEDIIYFEATTPSDDELDAEVSGINLGLINMKLNMGAGSETPKQTGVHTNTMPPGGNGPYIIRTTNTRPVPSPFT